MTSISCPRNSHLEAMNVRLVLKARALKSLVMLIRKLLSRHVADIINVICFTAILTPIQFVNSKLPKSEGNSVNLLINQMHHFI